MQLSALRFTEVGHDGSSEWARRLRIRAKCGPFTRACVRAERAAAVTDKDRVDARFCMGLELDYLALSFVQRAEDVHDLRAVRPSLSPSFS